MSNKIDKKAAGSELIEVSEVNNDLEVEIMELDEIIYSDFEKRLEDDSTIDLDEFILESESEEITLEQAVRDFRNGNPEAFDYLFAFYQPKLLNLARRMNDEDLSQELAVVLYRISLKFDATAGAKFNTYFWKCAQNHIGTQKIRRGAQKRGGNKKANDEVLKALKDKEKSGVGLSIEEQNQLMKLEEEVKPTKTISLQATFDTKDSSVEIGSFIEDQGFKNQFKTSVLQKDLDDLGSMLKEKEKKAIQMIILGYTLEEIGKELGNITAPAVHVMLRRLGKKKGVESRLREILG